jgi:hypothetical protein
MEQNKFEEEMALNRRAYEQLKEELVRNYAGQDVAIAFGRLIAASPSFDEAVAAVDRLQPPAEHCAVFLAGEEPHMEPYYSYFVEYS